MPGLEQPVGAAAINATPRAMITSAVREVCAAHGFSGNIAVTISVPEGVALAEKTFNPRLGIEDGISILGTTGIVEPRSLAALRDSIELEIRQHAAMGRCGVVLTPGNYGAQFISGHFHLNGAPVVFISNFVGDAIDCCVREGFTNVLLVGHIGKLVKVAGGIMDTHSYRRLPRGDSGRPRGLGRRGREDRARYHVVGHDHGGARGNRGRRRGGRCARFARCGNRGQVAPPRGGRMRHRRGRVRRRAPRAFPHVGRRCSYRGIGGDV